MPEQIEQIKSKQQLDRMLDAGDLGPISLADALAIYDMLENSQAFV